jgi:hypothetical protein
MKSPEISMPEQLPNESLRAYDAFKAYCGDPKRSIRRCARKLGKSSTIIARWSKRHQWQSRLRALRLADCERAVKADEIAKLNVAEERERLALRHTAQKLKASERLFERAHQVLQASTSRSRPSDSARMFLVAAELGNQALGLSGAINQTTAFGLRPVAVPKFKIVVHHDEKSRVRKKLEDQFFDRHPGIRRPPDILKVLDATIIDEHGIARSANDDGLRSFPETD